MSTALASELGQGVRREGNAFYVPSRTNAGVVYRVDLALDGALLCGCPAWAFRQDCWHVKFLKEEMNMSEPTALVPVQVQLPATTLPSEREMAIIDRAAELAFSGAIALPKELNTPQKVAAVMLYGFELGLKPMSSIRQIYIVEGRPQPSAEVMAGLLLRADPTAQLRVVSLTDSECTMRILRPSRDIDATYTVTMDDVRKAGLDRRDGWVKYPKDRLRWHATKRILRIYAPDAINGLVDVEANAGAVTAEWQEVTDAELYNEGDDSSRVIVLPPEPAPAPVANTSDAEPVDFTAMWRTLREWKVGPADVAAFLQVEKDGLSTAITTQAQAQDIIAAFRPAAVQEVPLPI